MLEARFSKLSCPIRRNGGKCFLFYIFRKLYMLRVFSIYEYVVMDLRDLWRDDDIVTVFTMYKAFNLIAVQLNLREREEVLNFYTFDRTQTIL